MIVNQELIIENGMVKVYMFKMPFSTSYFNKNQKIWVKKKSGGMACEVVGRFRGRKSYVSAWVDWSKELKKNPEIKKIEVSKEFADTNCLLILPHVSYLEEEYDKIFPEDDVNKEISKTLNKVDFIIDKHRAKKKA